MKKTLGRAFIPLSKLETIIVEIEAMLNDRPLTYVSSDITDPEALTAAHLIYGRRILFVPNTTEEIIDPTYMSGWDVRKQVDTHSQLIQQFWSHWRRGYLTALRKLHKTTGHNKQLIKKGDVVVHDNTPRLQWKLAIIEDLIKGNDGLVLAAHIRTENCRTTKPIVKLYPLEVANSDDQSPVDSTEQQTDDHPDEGTSADVDCPAELDSSSGQPNICKRRVAATKALRKMIKWIDVHCCPPEDVQN